MMATAIALTEKCTRVVSVSLLSSKLHTCNCIAMTFYKSCPLIFLHFTHSNKFSYLNTGKFFSAQRGSDNRGSTVVLYYRQRYTLYSIATYKIIIIQYYSTAGQ